MLNLLALFAGASAGVQAAGAAQSARANRTSLGFQADVADQNAKLAELQAQSILLRGQQVEQDVLAKGRTLAGDQRATMAANGVDLTEGSPLDILVSTEAATQRDAARTRDNAAQDAWAARVQGTNYRNQASAARSGMSQFSPGRAFGTSLLTSGTQLAARWYAKDAVAFRD